MIGTTVMKELKQMYISIIICQRKYTLNKKKERVGDVFFGMTSFYAKKSEKIKLVGEDKKSESLKLLQMFLNYVLQ